MEVVHRDLKPSNIFLGRTNRGREVVKLLDFGIAKAVDEDGMALTQSGIVAGTASFVAPERLIGARETYAMDVYSAALIILEMFMGRRVFDADTIAECLLMQLKSPVPIPRRLARTPLGDVLKRASVKHPDDRYPNAGAFLDAFVDAAAASPADLKLGPDDLPPVPEQTSPSLLNRVARGEGEMDMLEREASTDSSEQLPTSEIRTTDLLDTIVREVDTDDLDTTMITPTRQPEPVESREPTTFTEPEQHTTSSHWLLVALAGGLVVTAAVLGFAFFGEDDDPADARARAETEAAPTLEAKTQTPETQEPDPSPERHTVELRSSPAGAKVYGDNRLLGHTDFLFDFTEDHAPNTLRFELDGHEPARIDWPNDPGDELFVELEAIEEAEPASTEATESETTKPERRETRSARPRRRTRPAPPRTDDEPKKDEKNVDAVLDKYLPKP